MFSRNTTVRCLHISSTTDSFVKLCFRSLPPLNSSLYTNSASYPNHFYYFRIFVSFYLFFLFYDLHMPLLFTQVIIHKAHWISAFVLMDVQQTGKFAEVLAVFKQTRYDFSTVHVGLHVLQVWALHKQQMQGTNVWCDAQM